MVYATFLFCWLLLGLLPTLAQQFAAIRRILSTVADRPGPFSGFASRVLDADATMAMTPAGEAWLQYGFSVLNLSLALLLAFRRPRQRVPRLLAFALLGTAATFNDPSHRAFHLTGSPWPIALAHFIFHITSGVTYVWAVLLFPDGELPRPIRLPKTWLRLSVAGFTAATVAVSWFSSFLAHPQFFVIFFGVGVPALGVEAALLRLRDPQGPDAERTTSRLLCAALLPALATATLWLAATLLDALTTGPSSGAIARRVEDLFPIVFAIVPVVLCAAIVRYRLWDIDRLLGRVLVYGVIAGAAGVGYVVAVVTGGRLIEGGLWWTVLALALIATMFEPLRIRAGRWANRVVYGQVLSPGEAMHQLVDGLEQLSPAGGLHQIASVTVNATRATGATLWLLDGSRLVNARADDSAAATVFQVPTHSTSAEQICQLVGATKCWPIAYQGTQLGWLAITVPGDTTLTDDDQSLIRDVAGHAGLLVHNAVLSVRLARQVDELAEAAQRLRQARRRLVAAQDVERRRLERDLHEGAQHSLVAAIIGIRTARMLGDQGQPIGSALDELSEVTGVATKMLSDLLDTGRPAVLADHGLQQALEQAGRLARQSGLTVQVAVTPLRDGTDPDLWAATETAVYFWCVEALQNIAKHAGARSVVVEVDCTGTELWFQVIDDGRGFGASAGMSGRLPRLAERCELLGGRLEVASAPGIGTRIRGRVPLFPTLDGRTEYPDQDAQRVAPTDAAMLA